MPTNPANDNGGGPWIDWPAEPMPIDVAARALKAVATIMADPSDLEDCTEVYGDDVSLDLILEDLDLHNTCTDPGGHVWLAENGGARCIYCETPAMPVLETRESK